MPDLPELPPDAQARIRAAETAAEAIVKIYRAEGRRLVAEAYGKPLGYSDLDPASARFLWQETRNCIQQGSIDAAERVFDARAREYLKAVQPDVGRFLAILSRVGQEVVNRYGAEVADAIAIRNLVWQRRAWKQHPPGQASGGGAAG
jgi:hypothetical protein